MSASDHPAESVLAHWLETGEPSSVETHLDGCDQCSSRLDELTDLGTLQGELDVVTSPPTDLTDRTTAGVKGRLAAQEAVSVVAEMLTLPFRTAAVVIGGDEPRRGITARDRTSDETHSEDGERHDG